MKSQLVVSVKKEGLFFTNGETITDYHIQSTEGKRHPLNTTATCLYLKGNKYHPYLSEQRREDLKVVHNISKRRKQIPATNLYKRRIFIEDENNPNKKVAYDLSQTVILHAEQCIDAIVTNHSEPGHYKHISLLRKALK